MATTNLTVTAISTNTDNEWTDNGDGSYTWGYSGGGGSGELTLAIEDCPTCVKVTQFSVHLKASTDSAPDYAGGDYSRFGVRGIDSTVHARSNFSPSSPDNEAQYTAAWDDTIDATSTTFTYDQAPESGEDYIPSGTVDAALLGATITVGTWTGGDITISDIYATITYEASTPATPTNTTPEDEATCIASNPTLTASAYSEPHGDSHEHSQWQVSDDSFSTTVYDSGSTTDKESHTLPSDTLTYGNVEYEWRVRYKDVDGCWSGWSTPTSFTTKRKPNTPSVTAPINGSGDTPTSHPTTVTLTGSAFSDPCSSTHSDTYWQVSTTDDFSGGMIVDEAAGEAQTTRSVSGLTSGTDYYVRVKYQNNLTLWSDYSDSNLFTTYHPARPVNQSPADGANPVDCNVTLTASDFSDLEDLAHAASQWQISTTSDFAVVGGDTGEVAEYLTSYGWALGTDRLGETWYWRVRYKNADGAWSLWSVPTSFTVYTPTAPTITSPTANQETHINKPLLTGSSFDAQGIGLTHSSSTWVIEEQIVSSGGDVAYGEVESYTGGENLTTYSITTALSNKTYYVTLTYTDDNGGEGTVTRHPFVITEIDPTYPENGETKVSLAPLLVMEDFKGYSGMTHAATSWQVNDENDFTTPLWESLDDSENLTSIQMPTGYLSWLTTYWLRVRYKDNRGKWSNWL